MNPIRRLVQLVLDRRAAKQTENAARQALSPVEAGLARLKALAISVGSVLAAAFGVRALARFGAASVKAAMESEAAWADLAGTVRAAGGDFEAMEADIRSLATAFQEATAIGDEEFAGGLTKLIALTGDVSAATNNMGLVANVAAQFYKGDLAPAVELVGKVMNGNTTLLQRMGIKVQSAQEGLEVLAERSFGAASRQAETFGGKVKQLTNFWGDFQEELGAVITTSEEGVGALDVLIGVVRLLTGWVQRNREVIQVWIRGGLEAVIDVVDVLWRALKGMSQLIVGGFSTALGLAIQGTGLLARGFALVVEVGAKAARFLGAEELAESMTDFSARVRDQAAALNEWGVAVREAGEARVAAGIGTLSRQAFTGEGVLEGAAAAGRAKGEVPPELSAAPQMAAGAVTKVSEAIEEYENAIRAAHLLSATLGKDFDLLGAEASALTTVITKLSNEGIGPQDPLLQRYVTRLREVQQQMKETNAIQAFEEQMRGVAAGSELLGGSFDALGAKASALEQVIASLTAAGVDPSDARLQQYAQTLGLVQAQMAGNIEVADELPPPWGQRWAPASARSPLARRART